MPSDLFHGLDAVSELRGCGGLCRVIICRREGLRFFESGLTDSLFSCFCRVFRRVLGWFRWLSVGLGAGLQGVLGSGRLEKLPRTWFVVMDGRRVTVLVLCWCGGS